MDLLAPIRVDEVLSFLKEASDRHPGGGVAFDGDGTLWSGDIGEDFFDALLEHGLADVTRDALAREATEAGLDAAGDAVTIARRIHRAYLERAFPEERVCEVMTWAAAGMTQADLDELAARVISRSGLERRLHDEAIAVVESARALGVPVFLVSASPRAIVDQAARIVGISPERTIAVRELRDSSGTVLCGVERPISYGPGKVHRLRERLGAERPLYAAFGDNAFDVPMLQAAMLPVAIRPKPRLTARAAEVPALKVLTRGR